MKRYRREDFEKAFAFLGIGRGDCLFIHSSIFDFGLPQDIPISDVPKVIFELLMEKIGPEGTLAVPTFNFRFCHGKTYDREESPSIDMGVFSEYVRKLPQAIRSYHPMQSIAVVGKHAKFITKKDTLSAFEPESAFDRIIKLNAKLLLIGSDFSYNSAFHWVEEKQQVPYRYWKEFTASYTDGGEPQEKTYRMFVRDLQKDPQVNFKSIKEELKAEKKISSAKVGSGMLQIYKLNDFLDIATVHIKQNPYYFIENHPH